MKKATAKLLNAKQLLRAMGSQSASVYANQVIAFVVPWLVLTRTGSAASAGLVAFAMGLAAFIGTLSGGLVTDRIGGRKVSMIADFLSFATALSLALMLFFNFFALWIVVILQVIGVFFDGPGQIAKNTTIPAAAADANIPVVRAMGLQQTLENLARFLGPVTAGLLIAILSEKTTLLVASALFFWAIYLVARLPRKVMVHEHPMSARQAVADMKEAVRFIAKDPLLGPMQLFGPFYAFVIVPLSTIIFPAWFIFAGQSSAGLGLFLGVQAVGGVVGGIAFATYGPKVSQRKWMAGATALYALALISLSLVKPGSLVALVISFVSGMAVAGLFAVPYSAFYIRTPERLLGRVNSLGAAAGFLVIALASLFFGWLVHSTSAKDALLASGIVMAFMALGAALLPFMKHLDKAPTPEAAEAVE